QGRCLSRHRHGVPRDGPHRARRVAAALRDRAGGRRGRRAGRGRGLEGVGSLVSGDGTEPGGTAALEHRLPAVPADGCASRPGPRGGKLAELKGVYLDVVRAWGESIESGDSYTFGHCERVARGAVAMARALALDDQDETTVLLGAYVHDVGQLRIPHELLRKPGPLTREERDVVQ